MLIASLLLLFVIISAIDMMSLFVFFYFFNTYYFSRRFFDNIDDFGVLFYILVSFVVISLISIGEISRNDRKQVPFTLGVTLLDFLTLTSFYFIYRGPLSCKCCVILFIIVMNVAYLIILTILLKLFIKENLAIVYNIYIISII